MLPTLVNPFSWWQWAVLAAIPPAIIALYFLKLKRRPIEVPSTYLWHKSIEDLHVNTIWQRLRRNLLLFLQLLIVALIAASVIRPGWQSEKLPGNRFIFLIDNSASMQATDAAPSRLDEAKRQAAELIEQTESGDVAMVVSFSDIARVEQSFTGNRRQLLRSLDAIRPSVRFTSLAEALKYASSLANPGRSGEKGSTDEQVAEALPATLVVLSDGRFEDVAGFTLGNLDPIYKPIGSPGAANVGIVTFSLGRKETQPDQLQAFARLQNFGRKSAAVGVELFYNELPIRTDSVELPAGSAHNMVFDLGAIADGALRLKLNVDDDFALDNEAWLPVAQPRRARVLLVGEAEGTLAKAMATTAIAELAEVEIQPAAFLDTEKYRQQSAIGAYDLVLYDRCRPKELPRANTLFVGAAPEGGGWELKPRVASPQILDIDATHPLTQWLEMADVRFAAALPVVAPPGGKVLIDLLIGSGHGPLLAIAPRDGFEDAVLGCIFTEAASGKDAAAQRTYGTDWMIRTSFPTFMFNVVQYLGGGRAGQSEGSFRPGQQIFLESPVAGKPLVVKSPSGKSTTLNESRLGRFPFSDTTELGMYTTSVDSRQTGMFAVNISQSAESDIPSREEVKIGRMPVPGQATAEVARRELWKWIVAAGLVVLMLEWYIYVRRIYP